MVIRVGEQIKVTTQTLQTKCKEWVEIMQVAGQYYEAACKEIETLSTCFESQAANACSRAAIAERKKGKAVLESIQEQIKKINTIAAIYETAEKENTVDTTAD